MKRASVSQNQRQLTVQSPQTRSPEPPVQEKSPQKNFYKSNLYNRLQNNSLPIESVKQKVQIQTQAHATRDSSLSNAAKCKAPDSSRVTQAQAKVTPKSAAAKLPPKRKPLTGRVNKTAIDGKKFSYEETITDLNRTKVETTFVNTTLNETIDK